MVYTMSSESESKPKTAQPTEKMGEAARDVAQKTYGDFMGAYKSVTETSTKVVRQAAMILEEEIAQGIKIAQQTENRVPQMDKFRSEKPDEVMQRFRRDAHEVVDIFIDVVGATLKAIPNVADPNVLNVGNVAVKPVVVAPVTPVIKAPVAVKAGMSVDVQISFENTNSTKTEEFSIFCTDLVSSTGDRLPSKAIKFTPSTVKIAPQKSTQITVTVAIPLETKPGTYSGLVLASNVAEFRSEISIKVE